MQSPAKFLRKLRRVVFSLIEVYIFKVDSVEFCPVNGFRSSLGYRDLLFMVFLWLLLVKGNFNGISFESVNSIDENDGSNAFSQSDSIF